MRTFKRNLTDRHNPFIRSFAAKHDFSFARERSLLHLLFAAEPEDLGLSARSKFNASRIIGIQHGKIVGLLIFKNAGFRIHVSLKRSMAIQMIGRHVQHHGNFRPKATNRFQLKAGDFEHGNRLGHGFVHQRNRWRANVSAYQSLQVAGRKNFASQRSRRGLAIRACNCDDLSLKKFRR